MYTLLLREQRRTPPLRRLAAQPRVVLQRARSQQKTAGRTHSRSSNNVRDRGDPSGRTKGRAPRASTRRALPPALPRGHHRPRACAQLACVQPSLACICAPRALRRRQQHCCRFASALYGGARLPASRAGFCCVTVHRSRSLLSSSSSAVACGSACMLSSPQCCVGLLCCCAFV